MKSVPLTFLCLLLLQLRVLPAPRLQGPAVHHGVRETQRRLPALEELGVPLSDPPDPVHQAHPALRGRQGRGGGSPRFTRKKCDKRQYRAAKARGHRRADGTDTRTLVSFYLV